MKATASGQRRPWRRLISSTRKRVEIVALVGVILASGAVGFELAATADPDKLVGEPVPDGDVPAIVEAALSCPALNPPKLAAQIMAASGFKSSPDMIAGLDQAAWEKWRPSSDASRADRRANIIALGHRTCENVGHLRAADIDGDLWPAAIAAEQTGVKAVLDARGVPKDAKPYVDKVKAYAAWYAEQPQFSEKATTQPVVAAADGELKVPDALVQPIQVAGKVVPAGHAGEDRGTVADAVRFRREQANVGPPGRRPVHARPVGEVPAGHGHIRVATRGRDPGARRRHVRHGPGAVRSQRRGPVPARAERVPVGDRPGATRGRPARVNVTQLADQVPAHVTEYEKDSRLSVPVTKPSPTVKPSPTPSASRSVQASPSTSPSAKPMRSPRARSCSRTRRVPRTAWTARGPSRSWSSLASTRTRSPVAGSSCGRTRVQGPALEALPGAGQAARHHHERVEQHGPVRAGPFPAEGVEDGGVRA